MSSESSVSQSDKVNDKSSNMESDGSRDEGPPGKNHTKDQTNLSSVDVSIGGGDIDIASTKSTTNNMERETSSLQCHNDNQGIQETTIHTSSPSLVDDVNASQQIMDDSMSSDGVEPTATNDANNPQHQTNKTTTTATKANGVMLRHSKSPTTTTNSSISVQSLRGARKKVSTPLYDNVEVGHHVPIASSSSTRLVWQQGEKRTEQNGTPRLDPSAARASSRNELESTTRLDDDAATKPTMANGTGTSHAASAKDKLPPEAAAIDSTTSKSVELDKASNASGVVGQLVSRVISTSASMADNEPHSSAADSLPLNKCGKVDSKRDDPARNNAEFFIPSRQTVKPAVSTQQVDSTSLLTSPNSESGNISEREAADQQLDSRCLDLGCSSTLMTTSQATKTSIVDGCPGTSSTKKEVSKNPKASPSIQNEALHCRGKSSGRFCAKHRGLQGLLGAAPRVQYFSHLCSRKTPVNDTTNSIVGANELQVSVFAHPARSNLGTEEHVTDLSSASSKPSSFKSGIVASQEIENVMVGALDTEKHTMSPMASSHLDAGSLSLKPLGSSVDNHRHLFSTVETILGNGSTPANVGDDSSRKNPFASHSASVQVENDNDDKEIVHPDAGKTQESMELMVGARSRAGLGETHGQPAAAPATTSPLEPPKKPKSIIEIAEQTPEPVRSRHKQMLFNLFLHVDPQRVDDLAVESRSALPTRAALPGKRTASGLSSSNAGPCVLSILPNAMQHFRDSAGGKHESRRVVLDDSRKRKKYASMSLEALKDHVAKQFEESAFCKKSSVPSVGQESGRQQMPKRALPSAAAKTFTPFALEYNECSIAAICGWVGKQDDRHQAGKKSHGEPPSGASDSNVALRPTVAPMFRKCSVCGLFGHYEIECNHLGEEELLELAHSTKVQATISELVEKKMDSRVLGFRYFSKDGTTIRDTETAPQAEGEENGEDEYSRMHLACEVCNSGLDDDHMLICDGCDKLFHLFCLDPPLKQVPEGDWFCAHCDEVHQQVSSDVEIEDCDGFVIEQRKRPRGDKYLAEDDGIGLPEDGWQTAIAVIGDATNEIDEQPLDSSRGKRRRQGPTNEEKVEIDGFTIRARASSKSPHVSRRMKAWRMSTEDISQDPLVVGSVVAWFLPSQDENNARQTSSTSAETSTEPNVGVVLCVESALRRALVRQVVEWKDILLDSWTERTTESPERIEDCAVQAVSSGATSWISTDCLHLVGRAPPIGAIHRFKSEVLPARLANERRDRADAAGVTEPAAALMPSR